MTARLRFSREELLASHAYARPHREAGRFFHGGFDADGAYISPRTLFRRPAAEAWSAALEARGWPLVDPMAKLRGDPGYPTAAQHAILLGAGLGRTLWDQLSVIGLLEKRAGTLIHFIAPDMQAVFVEDIAETTLGHLNLGLLPAHGMDEAGDPQSPWMGAHDALWFTVRDLIFGENAYPVPAPPGSLQRPGGAAEIVALPEPHERTLKYLMNVLMVEAQAESLFTVCLSLFRNPALFADRRAAAETAAMLVERICADEWLHLHYLSTLISEFRSFTVKGLSGGLTPGAAIVDPIWAEVVDWYSIEDRRADRDATRADVETEVIASLGPSAGRAFMADFDALEQASG